MKKLKYLLILALAIAAWFFLQESKKPKSVRSLGGDQVQEKNNFNNDEIKSKIKTYDFSEPTTEVRDLADTRSKIDPSLTYLQAYRNTVFFQKCFRVINDINQGISPIIVFEKYVSFDAFSLVEKNKKKATSSQLQYFSDFVDRCTNLLENNDESPQAAKTRLHKQLAIIKPITDEEITLEKGLTLYNQKTELNSSLRGAKYGTSLLSEEEANEIKQKIRSYYNKIAEYKANPDWLTNQQIQNEIKQLNEKISQLRLITKNNRIIDTEKIPIIEAELIQLKNDMLDFLKQNNSPDILLLYARTFFYPIGNNSSIIQELRNELSTYENYFLVSIYEVGIKLAACAMNYPCDNSSDFIYDYCIGSQVYSTYPSACGKKLEDFYFNHYLGPNQIEDVSKFLNYILNNYVKN